MPCPTKPIWVPFSGEISGRTAAIIPMPMNDTEATASTTSAARKFASGMFSPKNDAITAKTIEARTTP